MSNLSYHAFKTPPAKVLDLGCGTGHWVLRAARQWTDTKFIGFDLVPIQPSLARVTGKSGGSIGANSYSNLRLDERIQWVHGNFLEKLPFKDAEFDMVRCRRIARGVPESKWVELYEEIVRVMKPGAAFEHVEEDMVFPTEIPNKPSQTPLTVYPTPSPSYASSNPPYFSSTSLSNGARGSIPLVRPPDQYRRSPSTSFSSAFDSPVEGRHNIPSASSVTSSASIVSTANSFTPLRSNTGSFSVGNPPTLLVPGLTSGPPNPDTFSTSGKDRESGDSAERGQRLGANHDISFYDPRVHTRLQELFISMHDARWINLKPLSLIPRLVQEHFTGMISSSVLNINMPPRPRDGPLPSRVADVDSILRVSGEPIIQQLIRLKTANEGPNADVSMWVPQPGDEEVAQYVSFDSSRIGSASMPTRKFDFDLGWLPMHLTCAAEEILGCKEAMWEHLKTQEPGFDRREYDAMIRQYQTDIQDRIGLSGKLREKLHWGPSESDFNRTADQRAFEDNYAQAIALDQTDPEAANRPPALMRCLRAFIAWKPT
ncbi:hypothetical protein BDV93DRAFT_16612 [Ceratobasidium sp. AG-I]|nr:hypothetical protein BDV93DRAFT_16612 [Ceratobasidium sp. AG-I]